MHANAFKTVRGSNPLGQNVPGWRVVLHDGNSDAHGLYFSPNVPGKIVVSFHYVAGEAKQCNTRTITLKTNDRNANLQASRRQVTSSRLGVFFIIGFFFDLPGLAPGLRPDFEQILPQRHQRPAPHGGGLRADTALFRPRVAIW
jgi:hypothetical protein